MKAIATAIVIALIGTFVYFQWNKSSEEIADVEIIEQEKPAEIAVDIKPITRDGVELSTGKDMFVKDSPSEKSPAIGEVEEKDSIVWQVSEEGEKVLKAEGKIPADVNNEAYVELDLAELNSVEIGDYLDLYIPQIGGSYTGEVDQIRVHENGDRTVEAYIPGAGTLYSAVITIGKDAVYGALGTQAGVYFMEGNGQYAWIASKSDLVSKHSVEGHKGDMSSTEPVTTVENNEITGL